MAAYTSTQTGDWNNVATWGGGGYPGDTGAQTDTATIANTHVVTLNITSLTGMCGAVTINAGGKVIVAANFNTDDDFTGDWSVSGELEFEKATPGTYELRVKNHVWILSGGLLDMDASGSGYKHTLSIQCVADSGDGFDVKSGGTAICKGRTKTVAAWISGDAAKTDTDIDVDDGAAGDVSGWEVNDEVVIATDDATNSHSEVIALTVDNGFAAGKHNYTCDALAEDHLDNSRIYNLTRSCVIQGCDATYAADVDIDSGSTVDFDYVEFWHHDEVEFDRSIGSTAKPFCGCSFWGMESGEYGLYLNSTQGSYSIELCVFYADQSSVTLLRSWQLYSWPVTIDSCYFVVDRAGTSGYGIYAYKSFLLISSCEIVGVYDGVEAALNTVARVKSCYFWAVRYGIRFLDSGPTTDVSDCVFGEDPGSHSANSVDADIAAWGDESMVPIIILNDCKLASSTEVILDTDNQWGRIQSLQHNQTTGYYKEWQRYGLIQSNAVEQRGDTYCIAIDPSSAVALQEVIYYLRLVVAVGDTPSLTFWVKDNNPANDGVYTIETGDEDCGLGAVAAGSPFTLTGVYAQKTITFTNAADRAGEVEVQIKIGDNVANTVIVYLDDIAVAGV